MVAMENISTSPVWPAGLPQGNVKLRGTVLEDEAKDIKLVLSLLDRALPGSASEAQVTDCSKVTSQMNSTSSSIAPPVSTGLTSRSISMLGIRFSSLLRSEMQTLQ